MPDEKAQVQKHPCPIQPQLVEDIDPSPSKKENLDKFNPGVFVRLQIDLTQRYGIGYILSDTTLGVYFNDNTNMILPIRKQTKVLYFETVTENGVRSSRNRHFDYYLFPEDMKKKCMIFRFIKKLLEKKEKD